MSALLARWRLRAHGQVVGRDAELRAFRQSLVQAMPEVNVFMLHGPGGIGKTTLMHQMAEAALAEALPCLHLDGRDIEPSVHGLLQALGSGLGLSGGGPFTREAVLQQWHAGPRRLLMLDTFEHLQHLERWLRDKLLAEMPADSLVVVASRTAPQDAWRTDPLWRQGACILGLRNLAPGEGALALQARGLNPAQSQAIAKLSYGHPLAMMLMADVVSAQGDVPDALGIDVIRRLTDCFAAQLPSALHRHALDISAQARLTTEGLLASTVDAAMAPALFAWLASLSFMTIGAEGLFPHDLVRDALVSELRWRHPEQLAQDTGRLLKHYLAQGRSTTASSQRHHRAALDIFFLNRGHPLLHQFVQFEQLGTLSCEVAEAAEFDAIARLTREELGPEHESLLHRWRGHPAATLWVVRETTASQVLGARLCLDINRINPEAIAADPALTLFQQWVQSRAPLRPDQVAMCERMAVVRGGALAGAALINAMQARSFSVWMSEPRLAAYSMSVSDAAYWQPLMNYIDFHLVDDPRQTSELDGQAQGVFAHDWRTSPIDDWLLTMVSRVTVPTDMAPPSQPSQAPLQMLSEAMFEEAVWDALRQWHEPTALKGSPLLASRLIRMGQQDQEAPTATLRRLIDRAAQALATPPRSLKFFNAVDLTYLRPAPSQELAAERLGIPYGTYRYRLRTGVNRIARELWLREIQDITGPD